MKHLAIATLAAAALLAGCADDEQLGTPEVPEAVVEAQTTAQTQPALSPEQQLMKQNLDAAAQLLVAALNKPMVQRELQQLDYEKIRTDRLSFEQLLRNPAKDGSFRCLATELGRSLNAGAKSGNNLADYLIEQGCELYLPYPLDWYPADAPITVAGHPIDNVEQGIGYVVDKTTGTPRTVLVNDEYADKNPVAIIQMIGREGRNPEDGRDPGGRVIRIHEDFIDDGGGSWGGGGSSSPKVGTDVGGDVYRYPEDIAGKRCKVYLGEVFLDQKPKLFEGDVELFIKRMDATGAEVHLIEIPFPKSYIKAGQNGWSQCRGGWLEVEQVLDEDWYPEKVTQAMLAYDQDPEKSFKELTFSLTIAGYGANVSIKRSDVQVKYDGDLFGYTVWNRKNFIYDNTHATPSDKTRTSNGYTWTIRKLGAMHYTTPTYWMDMK